MGDTANTTENTHKKSWFKGIKSEFKKIIWPNKKDLVKQTGAVIAISVALGIIISFIDLIIKFGVEKLIG